MITQLLQKLGLKSPASKYDLMVNGFTGETIDPTKTADSNHDRDKLSERELDLIFGQSICPDCGGEIRWGPCGGMNQNVKCFGKCEARFNMCHGAPVLSERQTERTHRDGKPIDRSPGVEPTEPWPRHNGNHI